MALQDLSSRVTEVRNTARPRWPLAAARLSQHLDAELADPRAFGDACRWIADVAADHHCDRLLGASLLGERLAGGAIATAGNGLGILTPDGAPHAVLIVDGSLATGAQLLRASDMARAAGATRVAAAVIVSVPEDPALAVQDEIADVFVLNTD